MRYHLIVSHGGFAAQRRALPPGKRGPGGRAGYCKARVAVSLKLYQWGL